jgi:hypothetical protein
MNRLFLFILITGIITLSCLNPEHDNAYDPENPNKAKLFGKVHNIDDSPGPHIKVALLYDNEIKDETNSDNDGLYEFSDIDPGIYMVTADYAYYIPETLSAPLPADTENQTDIYFKKALFDFEDEPLNTQEPHGFSVVIGAWSVIDEPDQGHVYEGTTPGTGLAVAITNVVLKDFYYKSMVKVDTLSDSTFVAGILFRYRDSQNFYIVIFLIDRIVLIKAYSGVWIPIDTILRGFSLDKWYTLSVGCSGDHIQVFLDNDSDPLFDVHDNTFPDGHVGLFAEHYASVKFDNVYIDISKE